MDGQQNLWVMDLLRASKTRLTLDEANHVDPRWSPDGRQVIFGSTRDPSRSPFRVSLPSSNPEQVFKFDGKIFSLDDYSPDGRYILYHDSLKPELWALPLTGDRKPMLVTRSLSGVVDQAQFSPDGPCQFTENFDARPGNLQPGTMFHGPAPLPFGENLLCHRSTQSRERPRLILLWQLCRMHQAFYNGQSCGTQPILHFAQHLENLIHSYKCDCCCVGMRILCAKTSPDGIKKILDCPGLPSRPSLFSSAVRGFFTCRTGWRA